jgi:hypothetical protein
MKIGNSRETEKMGGNILSRWRWLGIALFLICIGCNTNDRDHLARAAIRAKLKLEGMTGGSQNVATGWQAMTLDARVAARLRWDKSLADQKIHVTASGGIVALTGTVPNLTQRRRAVDLAESTIGTEKVEDSVEVASEAP